MWQAGSRQEESAGSGYSSLRLRGRKNSRKAMHILSMALMNVSYMPSSKGRDNTECFDNAPMESFWGTLKQELIHHRRYRTRQEAIRDITEYIELFYNRQRQQAKLGFLSPVAYEQRFYAGLLAA